MMNKFITWLTCFSGFAFISSIIILAYGLYQNPYQYKLGSIYPRKKLYLNVFEGIHHSYYSNKPNLTTDMTFWYLNIQGNDWLAPLYDKHHNITFCQIPKNTGTLFRTIFYVLTTQKPNKNILVNPLRIHGRTTKELSKFTSPLNYYNHLFNNQWNSWVVLRDPLERYLSAYLFRCVFQKHCFGLNKKNYSDRVIINDFKLFSKYFIKKWNNINTSITNIKYFDHHYLPQHTFCMLEYFIDYYDYIIFINKTQLAKATLFVMQQLGIEKYYYLYGTHGKSTIFQKDTRQTQNSAAINKIKKYFDKNITLELYNKVFYYDYKYLNIPFPYWFKQL